MGYSVLNASSEETNGDLRGSWENVIRKYLCHCKGKSERKECFVVLGFFEIGSYFVTQTILKLTL